MSNAADINKDGQIVGWSQSGDYMPTRRAVMWTNGVPTDLNSLLRPDAGWTLEMAMGISDAGHVIGIGKYADTRTGFLLTLPKEPVVFG
jgi:probable HAF family extracellular repeat protein